MPKRVNHLEPAHSIIEAFGGCTRLGNILGLTRSAVALWRSPKRNLPYIPSGQIPEKHIPALRDAAKKYKINLEIDTYEVTIQRMEVRLKK